MTQNHFTVVVIGDNHKEIMAKYDNKIKVEPYITMKLSEAKSYHRRYISFYEEILKRDDIGEEARELAELSLQTLREQDDIDFFLDTAANLDYEINEETGDAYSSKNPNGKYDFCKVGKELSMPLKDYEGNEIFSAKKSDIDWSAIHLANTYPYEVAWDTVMEGKKPEGKREEQLYENMKNRTGYFQKFGTKENYVACSTAFWGYAYVDKNGWIELEENVDQFKWVSEFFERFILNLPDDETITIYECVRN